MTDKSHVSMEQNVCVVCGQKYDTGAILLDTRIDRATGSLRQSMERNTLTGWGMCDEHQKLADSGYIALIGAIPDGPAPESVSDPGDINRTGEIVHITFEAFAGIFNVHPPQGRIAFVDSQVIEQLKTIEENRAREAGEIQ